MDRHLRILLVEDNPGDARLLKELLKEASEGFALDCAPRLSDALERLRAETYDVVLLDLSLPDSHGIQTLDSLARESSGVPIVVLTGQADEELALRAVQNGAQDYLVKGAVDSDGLTRALRYAVERHRILAELEQSRRLEHYLATHDGVTRLPNRQLFYDRLTQALAEARRDGSMVAVLFLDLDRFKLTNDTLGHAAGDRLLQAVARRLSGTIRESDTVARLGGDEFTIILHDVRTVEDVARVAQKIIDVLARPFQLQGETLYTSTSIGISLYPSDGLDLDSLVRNADVAMYRAKALGGGKYQFYLPTMNDRAQERLELERQLRQAVERDELLLHYQPQLDIATGEIISLEALIRWRHPKLGIVAPRDFIPLAEESGLILPIGEWVLRTACQQQRAWLDSGLPPVRVAVNFSARQFQQENPVRSVLEVLKEFAIDPRLLELELTESVLMSDADAAVSTLRELQRHGIQVAMDDFGTGYSSLSYLKKLPLSKLKIDGAFVRSLTVDAADRAIVSAIVGMAHSLQLLPIAECLETVEQLEILRDLGCDAMQGFLFSRPLSVSGITRLLASHSRIEDRDRTAPGARRSIHPGTTPRPAAAPPRARRGGLFFQPGARSVLGGSVRG